MSRLAVRVAALPVLALLAACTGPTVETGSPVPSPAASSAATATATTATTTAAPAGFSASVLDTITALNMQLPVLHDGATPLPTTVRPGGVFGGKTTPDIAIYLLPQNSAFSKVQVVTVHVAGSGGAFQTPARLLSGVGASLYELSAEAVEAFHRDALPKLSTITQVRTKVTVGRFYDLTVVLQGSSSLAFVFTPVGVEPSVDHETLGR